MTNQKKDVALSIELGGFPQMHTDGRTLMHANLSADICGVFNLRETHRFNGYIVQDELKYMLIDAVCIDIASRLVRVCYGSATGQPASCLQCASREGPVKVP